MMHCFPRRGSINRSCSPCPSCSFPSCPGLGTRIADAGFTGQFPGKPADVKLKAQGGDIDAVSGATISSNGAITALGNAARVYAALKPEIVKAWP